MLGDTVILSVLICHKMCINMNKHNILDMKLINKHIIHIYLFINLIKLSFLTCIIIAILLSIEFFFQFAIINPLVN